MKMEIIRFLGRIAIAAAMMAAFQLNVAAQEYVNTPVSISKEKVRVNGEVCYSHVVLERQTLFSISKAYGVTVEDIYRMNPGLKETGLKKNAIIIIPAGKTDAPDTQASATTVPSQEDKADTRQDKKKEAIDPVRTEPARQKAKAKKQTIHVRKWYEDLITIAERYGVTPEAIMQANGLTTTKLSNRQKLVIPEKSEIEVITEETAAEIAEAVADSTAKQETDITAVDFTPKDKVSVTMLLPLRNADGRINRNNMDFYSGALLAIYDLAEEGISTDFSMFDISDKTHPITYEDIDGSDMVIGPVSGSDINRLLTSFPPTTMVISPLDPRVEDLTSSHGNLIQVPTPAKTQYLDIIDWIKEDLTPADTVLVISEKAFKQSDAAKMMMEIADSSGIAFNSFSYNILEGRDVVEPLKLLMTKYGTNRVMIASESEAFVNDVVRNMNLMLYEQYKVVLYAPSKIRSFDTIEVEHFHKTNMHVSLTYYIDYDDLRVKDFLLKYRALYNTEPSQFAFQGYDIARYFINLCSRYGDRWPEMTGNAPQAMLQSTLRCVREDKDSGYINNGIRRIVYGDGWSVNEVK